MPQLSRSDLWSLEEYAEQRPAFRARVMEHKKNRQLGLGEHTRLYFEDRLTIHYQIQEMLRIEKLFEADAINEELAAYNPLIPDGSNWKATFMIEYEDPRERERQLEKLLGIEDKVWLQVDECERIWPIADEDLDRSRDTKTSSVHFLRFELAPPMVAAVQRGAGIHAGIEHPEYHIEGVPVPAAVRDSLASDLSATAVN